MYLACDLAEAEVHSKHFTHSITPCDSHVGRDKHRVPA